MIHPVHKEDCCGCCACEAVCSHGAIRMVPDGMGFLYPRVDAGRCVDCGLCESVCAFTRPRSREEDVVREAEALRFPDFLDRSQSGGLAYALMRKALMAGYKVYGAAMDADFVVRHRHVEDEEGLQALRLSKYVQSDMAGIPAQVLADLKAGRDVFFTGTACQCAGVASLCRAYRSRLLLMDIVCHGVPAPYVWRDYLDYVSRRHDGKMLSAIFRDPDQGWHASKEKLVFSDGTLIRDDYAFLYYQCYMMRPSCHACPYARLSRPSDLTAADCWGVEKVLPGFADDNRGCSLALIHTPAGRAFADDFPDRHLRSVLPVQSVLQENLQRATRPSPFAGLFAWTYRTMGFAVTFHLFGQQSLLVRSARKLRRWVRTIKQRQS